MNDWERLQDWLELLDDGRLACLVEIASVLAADQAGWGVLRPPRRSETPGSSALLERLGPLCAALSAPDDPPGRPLLPSRLIMLAIASPSCRNLRCNFRGPPG